MNPVLHLDSILGVWARRFIRWPDGRDDAATRVWWVQGKPHFADLRIPADRPTLQGVCSLQKCDDVQRAWMSRQQGFAGILASTEENWLWTHEIDYRPRIGKRDIGRLAFNDLNATFLTEEGIDEPYIELWERIDDAASTDGQALVLKLTSAGEQGILIAIGSHFIMALDRRRATNQSARVEELDVEISHGLRNGPISQWTISESTFPWREGTVLFGESKVAVDWHRRILIESREWKIVEPTNGHLNWVF
jgi:hypothetical protein